MKWERSRSISWRQMPQGPKGPLNAVSHQGFVKAHKTGKTGSLRREFQKQGSTTERALSLLGLGPADKLFESIPQDSLVTASQTRPSLRIKHGWFLWSSDCTRSGKHPISKEPHSRGATCAALSPGAGGSGQRVHCHSPVTPGFKLICDRDQRQLQAFRPELSPPGFVLTHIRKWDQLAFVLQV